MEDEIEIRNARYKQMSTQELLELHGAGVLSGTAYDVLEGELRERGATIPSRPKGEETLAEVDKSQNHRGIRYSNTQKAIIIFIVLFVTPILALAIFALIVFYMLAKIPLK